MLLILILSFLWMSLAFDDQLPPESTDDDCPIIRERKTLDWDFILTPDPLEPQFINYYDLVAPGAGFVWRGEAYYYLDVTRPILFQNGQGWRLVNCSSYFEIDDPARGGCTTPDLALLSIPGTRTGDPPPEKGKIGTIHGLTYPAISPWAVYDLIEFRLTPVVLSKYYNELITVEVFGWREDGTITTTLRFKIKGSEVGYRVELPKDWNAIIQWQVRVWWSTGSRPTREEFQYLIDDVVINEYALGSVDFHCRYPKQTPKSPPDAPITLTFDDIPTLNSSTTLPIPYHGYIFDDKYSPWNITNHLSYAPNSPGRFSSTSKPNALLGTPRVLDSWFYSPNLITTQDFLFDIDSFHISIDNSTTSSQNPNNIVIIISAFSTCFNQIVDPFAGDTQTFIAAPSFSFTIDLTKGFKKYHAVGIYVIDGRSSEYLPFWIDDVVVRSWKNALGGLPGCERCGSEMAEFCEYPVQERPEQEGGGLS